jgi:perosamine synthetase
MTNLQAAIGCAQMEHADDAKKAKIDIARKYNDALGGVRGITLPPACDWATNVYWVYGILIEDEFGISRAEAQRRLEELGIETRTFFFPTHRQKMFPTMSGTESKSQFPVSNRLWDRGFYIPSYIGMGDDTIAKVAEGLKSIRG